VLGFVVGTAILVLVAGCAGAGSPSRLEAAVVAGDWRGIEAAAAAWLRGEGFQREAAVLLGYAVLARGDASGAVRHFLRARSGGADRRSTGWVEPLAVRHPDRPLVQLLAGHLLAREGDLRAALARLDTALWLYPDLAVARVARATLRGAIGHRAGAFDDLTMVADRGPAAPEALVVRAALRLEEGHRGLALADLDRARMLAPEHAVLHNLIGVLHARDGAWASAARAFETAFRLAPELIEARRNWHVAQMAVKRGAVLSAKGDVTRLTIVIADKDRMNSATALASDALRARAGQTPMVTTNAADAITMSRSHPVILQVSNSGLGAVAGDRVFGTLNTLGKATGGRATVDVITQGFGAADNTTLGILRHQNTVPTASQVRLGSLHMVDYSEASGRAGKTPLAVTDVAAIAKRGNELQTRGVAVVGYPTEGKPGVQHLGNIKAFQEHGIPTYAAQWQGQKQVTVGIQPKWPFVGPGFGVSNAADAAGSRANLGSRDWIFRSGGVERHLTGTLPELMKQQIGGNPSGVLHQRSPATAGTTHALAPGGVRVGPVSFARAAGGRVVFSSDAQSGEELVLVHTLFGVEELGGQANQRPGK
jgi:tetratricopeptide (TPR) repeat protein